MDRSDVVVEQLLAELRSVRTELAVRHDGLAAPDAGPRMPVAVAEAPMPVPRPAIPAKPVEAAPTAPKVAAAPAEPQPRPSHGRGAVHLAVVDPHAPWNNGPWVLEVADGHAAATPGGDGTVEASIGGLSSWWAGYAPATRLARTGHLGSADRRALALMDQLIPATPGVLPDFY